MKASQVKGKFFYLFGFLAAIIMICCNSKFLQYEQNVSVVSDNLQHFKGSLKSPALQIVSYDEFWSSSNEKRYEVNPTTEYQIPPQDDWLMKKEPLRSDHIPKTLTKVFLQKPGGFPDFSDMVPELKNAHASWKEKNPDYNIQYFDLKLCRDYLAEYFHPVFLRAFDCIQPFAGKADFFRMALIYHEGGW